MWDERKKRPIKSNEKKVSRIHYGIHSQPNCVGALKESEMALNFTPKKKGGQISPAECKKKTKNFYRPVQFAVPLAVNSSGGAINAASEQRRTRFNETRRRVERRGKK